MKYSILLAIILLTGCATQQPAFDGLYVLKSGTTWDKVITDPFMWASRNYEESCPVTYVTINGVKQVKLQEAWGDLDHDGKIELFLGNGPGRSWQVTVFAPVKEGYRYIGTLAGSVFRILPEDDKDQSRMLVFEPCGGHYGYIKAYTHDGKKFVCTSSEGIHCGDGAPDENNRRLDELFFSDSAKNACLKWRKH
jgi:hypothetical protein